MPTLPLPIPTPDRDQFVLWLELAAAGFAALGFWLNRARPAARLAFGPPSPGPGPGPESPNGKVTALRTSYRPGEKIVLPLVLTDAAGNPGAYLPSPPVWTSSHPETVQVIPDPTDGLSAVLAFLQPGSADVAVRSGDLHASQAFTVTGGPAVAVAFGEPVTPAPT